MPLTSIQKEQIISEVSEVASNAISAVAAEYRGLTVVQMTDLRKRARDADLYLKVIKNTLAKRAFENTEFACLSDTLKGPMLLAFSANDPGGPARLFQDFAKDNEALVVQALSLGGQLHAADQLMKIAKLPTYDEAIAQLMSVMIAPIGKLARTLSETYAQVVRVMAQVRDQKK